MSPIAMVTHWRPWACNKWYSMINIILNSASGISLQMSMYWTVTNDLIQSESIQQLVILFAMSEFGFYRQENAILKWFKIDQWVFMIVFRVFVYLYEWILIHSRLECELSVFQHHLVSRLSKDIRCHTFMSILCLATSTMGCQPGDCIWQF